MLVSALLFACALAAPPSAHERIRDDWTVLYLGDAAVGYQRDTVDRIVLIDGVILRSASHLQMTMARLGDALVIEQDAEVDEAQDTGQLSKSSFTLTMSGQPLRYELEVTGEQATVRTTTVGRPSEQTVDWNPEWIGPLARQRWMIQHAKAGETAFAYTDYSAMTGPQSVQIQVREPELVEIPGVGSATLRCVQTTAGGTLAEQFYDDEWELRYTRSNEAGLVFHAVPSTEEHCLKIGAKPDPTDALLQMSPPTNIDLPSPMAIERASYRIRSSKLDALEDLEDSRQSIVGREGDDSVILEVRRLVPTRPFALPLTVETDQQRVGLQSNALLQCADERLASLAKTAVRGTDEAWAAAVRLERFVHRYIADKNYGVGFATALEVLDSRTGDCSEHAVLLTAMCRAAGIPSRIAGGMVYYGDVWMGHMWSEVLLGDEWYALDATLAAGGIAATHLCSFRDSLEGGRMSWAEDAASGFGNVEIDVLSFTLDGRRKVVGEADANLRPARSAPLDASAARLTADGALDLGLPGGPIPAPAGYSWELVQAKPKIVLLRCVRADHPLDTISVSLVAPSGLGLESWADGLIATLEDSQREARSIGGLSAQFFSGRRNDIEQIGVVAEIPGAFLTGQMISDEAADVGRLEALVEAANRDR